MEKIKKPRGTMDILPGESELWIYVESKMRDVASRFGFSEVRTPTFEELGLFKRGVGDTTDVVQKEMYTFDDKGSRSLTLRPELTAGVIRSIIEHGLVNGALPVKVCYEGGCYRYEKPQAGRLREFHQFGVECVGAAAANADAEVIALARQLLNSIGVNNISLMINSIGCPECRKNYHKALKEYFTKHTDTLCETCKDRLERNPMRILDCKSPVCSKIAADAPVVLDYLCDECANHFNEVKSHLDSMGIAYTVDPHIVRGLDYYTRTVFEFVSSDLGAQSTVCGGGRYDGLIAQMGGPKTAALGFAMGLERLMLVLAANNVDLPSEPSCDIFFVTMGDKARIKASELSSKLRDEGFSIQTDICGRGLKAQMKYADKIGAKFTAVLGDDEIENNKFRLKNMKTGNETEVDFNNLTDTLYSILLDNSFSELTDAIEI